MPGAWLLPQALPCAPGLPRRDGGRGSPRSTTSSFQRERVRETLGDPSLQSGGPSTAALGAVAGGRGCWKAQMGGGRARVRMGRGRAGGWTRCGRRGGRWAPALTVPASLSLVAPAAPALPLRRPPQTGRGAHGRGAAPVAAPAAAVLLSVCPCLEAPPGKAPVSLRPARHLRPGLERQRGALPARPGPPPRGGQPCADPGRTPRRRRTDTRAAGARLPGGKPRRREASGPAEGRKTEIKDLLTQNGLD